MKFVDPACGSGSFLVGAYKYLLDYHLNWYLANNTRIKNAENKDLIYKDAKTKEYKLSVVEKKRILVNNIYGVDIDAQAVEVSKLSLFLQLLENEGYELSKNGQYRLFKKSNDIHILPNLSSNIKCGNSLIGTDYYADKDLSLFGIKEQRKINAFDWEIEFSEVFANGGFDAVIGNPPYYNIQTLGAHSTEVDYISKKYINVYQDKSDILFYFIALALKHSKNMVGFIVSNAFLFSDKAQNLRREILKDNRLHRIVNFENYFVFKGVGITTCIALFGKYRKELQAISIKDKLLSEIEVDHLIHDNSKYHSVELNQNDVFALITNIQQDLNEKIDKNCLKLQELCFVGKGMETASDDVFLFKEFPKWIPDDFVKIRVTGKNVERYAILHNNESYILYYEDIDEFKELPTVIAEYLLSHKEQLSNRATCKNEGRVWWKYSRPMHKDLYKLQKLYCSRRCLTNTFCYDEGFERLGFSNMTIVFGTNPDYNLKYILTLLNSKMLSFRYRSIGKQTGGGSFEYFPNGVGKLLIKPITLEEQQPFILLADQMMDAKKQLHEAVTDSDKAFIQQRIDALDKKIDRMVYELYELSDDEIAIIENES